MKKFFFILISLLLLFALYFAYEQFTGDFRRSNITMELPYRADLEISSLSHDEALLNNILNQEFVWLDQGHQIFAFQSADGKYVLKIFKFKRLKPSWITQTFMHMPWIGSYFERQEKRRLNRLQKLFNGYYVAYKRDRDNTGLIYVRLNRSPALNRSILVRDRLHIKHQINLDEIYFAIQKKGRSTRKELSELLDRGDVEKAKFRVQQLFEMYAKEYKNGIVDRDHNIIDNTGFRDGQPMRLDIGQLSYQSQADPEQFVQISQIILKRISHWLKKYYPEYHDELLFASPRPPVSAFKPHSFSLNAETGRRRDAKRSYFER